MERGVQNGRDPLHSPQLEHQTDAPLGLLDAEHAPVEQQVFLGCKILVQIGVMGNDADAAAQFQAVAVIIESTDAQAPLGRAC